MYERFAATLRELMEASEVSGAELGRRLDGTDKSLVSRWRNGLARPEAETVAKIADIFGVDQISMLQLAEWLPGEPKDIDPRRASLMMIVRDEVADEDLTFVERLLLPFRVLATTRAKSDSGTSARNRQRDRSGASSGAEESVDTVFKHRKHGVRVLAFTGA